jgi:hypothetical protein
VVIFCRQMMFALLKSSVCELWLSKELFSALLLLLVIFMALISFLMTVSWYYSRLRHTTIIFSSKFNGKIRLFSVLLFYIYPLFMWLDWSTAVFTGLRSFTKSLLFDSNFPFLPADSSVPEGLSASNNYTSNNPPRMQNQRLLVQF